MFCDAQMIEDSVVHMENVSCPQKMVFDGHKEVRNLC